ncbi:MAG: integration host factor subunit alpha [Deltaproteobacteria bacterium]|nr:integration host factor subunit alpha [Deltaproteobacteria bacterium]
MTLTKADIVQTLHEKFDIPQKEAVSAVESLIEIMKATLEQGEDLLISGFGKFSVKKKRERKGRNPATGEEITLSKRKVVTFSYSSNLREKLNPAPPEPAPKVEAPAPKTKTKTKTTGKTAPAAAAAPQSKAKTRSKSAKS